MMVMPQHQQMGGLQVAFCHPDLGIGGALIGRTAVRYQSTC